LSRADRPIDLAGLMPAGMRALLVTNMYPSPEFPARGRFVYDQVQALCQMLEVDVEVHAFEPGSARAYLHAASDLRRKFRGERFDVVHSHFGLTAWPAMLVGARAHAVTLHGTDLVHPRSRALTLAALRRVDLVATVSAPLAERVPRWAVRGRHLAVLPCGVDLERFRPIDRGEARSALGLGPAQRYLLFPADPARAEKRHDRAVELAAAVGARLLTLGGVHPDRVPLFVNAADAVVVTSEREGFGLAVLEALACDMPVLATPCGIAPEALAGVSGVFCGPYGRERWAAVLADLFAAGDRRIAGRVAAQPYSSVAMAARVVDAWRDLLGESGPEGRQP
jgi:glycosyltransferase involved in cell wall biosynthesis